MEERVSNSTDDERVVYSTNNAASYGGGLLEVKWEYDQRLVEDRQNVRQ